MKSKPFKKLVANNFAKWGSFKAWRKKAFTKNTTEYFEVMATVQNLKDGKKDTSFIPQDKTKKRVSPNTQNDKKSPSGNVSTPISDDQKSNHSVSKPEGNSDASKRLKRQTSDSSSEKQQPEVKFLHKKTSKNQASQSLSPKRKKPASQSPVNKNRKESSSSNKERKMDDSSEKPDTITWQPGKGMVDNKGFNFDFSGATAPDSSKADIWLSAFDCVTGEERQKPLTKTELQEQAFHGFGKRELAFNRKFSRTTKVQEYRATTRSRQPMWLERPKDSKTEPHFYRLPLVRLWEESDIDFSKIPSLKASSREKALKRLKKYHKLSIDKPSQIELLVLRHLTARYTLASECLSKLFQKITVDSKNQKVLDSIRIARRIFADIFDPHYELISELDTIAQNRRSKNIFAEKQKRLLKRVLGESFDFPTFESTSTDEDLDQPPKVSVFGKPADVKLFEKNCYEVLKRKPASRASDSSSKKGRGRKRKQNDRQPPRKKKMRRGAKKAWECKTCKTWHGKKDNYKCPKKSRPTQT